MRSLLGVWLLPDTKRKAKDFFFGAMMTDEEKKKILNNVGIRKMRIAGSGESHIWDAITERVEQYMNAHNYYSKLNKVSFDNESDVFTYKIYFKFKKNFNYSEESDLTQFHKIWDKYLFEIEPEFKPELKDSSEMEKESEETITIKSCIKDYISEHNMSNEDLRSVNQSQLKDKIGEYAKSRGKYFKKESIRVILNQIISSLP